MCIFKKTCIILIAAFCLIFLLFSLANAHYIYADVSYREQLEQEYNEALNSQPEESHIRNITSNFIPNALVVSFLILGLIIIIIIEKSKKACTFIQVKQISISLLTIMICSCIVGTTSILISMKYNQDSTF